MIHFPHNSTSHTLATSFGNGAATSSDVIDMIFMGMLVFTGVVITIVLVAVLYFIVRYRAGTYVDRSRPIADQRRLEIIFITLFTIIGLSLFAWAAKGFYDIQHPPENTQDVYVVGKQWMWKIHHDSGRGEINELHVPVNQPIKLIMTSQDVIHSFYIPAFRLKQDVLPDRYTTMWFEAARPGVYDLFCAEYCGMDHSRMIGKIVVMEPADYQQWLSAQSPEVPTPGLPGTAEAPLALDMNHVFTRYGCHACHVPDNDIRAPQLAGIYNEPVRLDNGTHVIADENYLREAILRPNAKMTAGYPAPSLMPIYEGMISEDDMRDMIEFIKSIRDGWPEGDPQSLQQNNQVDHAEEDQP